MAERRLLVLKTGTKIAAAAAQQGDYEDWVMGGVGDALVIDAVRGRLPTDSDALAGVVVTGSASMVSEHESWVLAAGAWLAGLVEDGVPVLGICFGHQLLAEALGGHVGYNPAGVEVGTTLIELTPAAQDDPLFETLPERFAAQVTHRQSVLELPPGARLLARSDLEPHQAFVVGDRAWGVQFHPEFPAAVMPVYVESYRGQLQREGRDVKPLLAGVAETPYSASLLPRFAALCREMRQ